MVSDLFFYQLGLIALVWLCCMLGSDIHVCAVQTVRWHGRRVQLDRESLRGDQGPCESLGVSQGRRCPW